METDKCLFALIYIFQKLSGLIYLRNSFRFCVEKEKIDKQLGGHSQYDLFGLYVIDLGRNIIKDIVVGYYLFLSEEILDYNNVQLIHNKKVMNLLTYRAGLH